MRLLIPVVFLLLFMGCEENESDSSINHGHNHNAVIVSLQDSDNVAIVSSENLEFEEQISIDLNTTDCSEISNQMECEMAGCMWHIMDNGMTHCMDMDMGGSNNARHDIAERQSRNPQPGLGDTEDYREAITSFVEKRDPVFKGR